jgi:biotin--protein ligase
VGTKFAGAKMSRSLRRILVYTDGGEGASEVCVAITLRELKRAVSWLSERGPLKGEGGGSFVVEKTDAAAIREGTLKERCRLLVLPGGRDLPYCSKLNGEGNTKIRKFVRDGGSYLGLCAGGYYGTSYVQFAVGDPVMEVVGPRELKFFPGVAQGPTFPGFQYNSNSGARACSIVLRQAAQRLLNKESPSEDAASLAVYYNGGGHFTHSETTSSPPHDADQPQSLLTNVEVLASYDVHCLGNGQDVPASNGATVTDTVNAPLPDGPAPLPNSPAAVVSSQYGAGKVILTGVHPESSATSLTELYSGDPYIEGLAGELEASEKAREALFNAMVSHLLF